jgi:hypothetical protein
MALGRVGAPAPVRQTMGMCSARQTMRMCARAGLPHNLSIDTDPQQQEAASPLMLVVRSFLR